MKKNFTAIFFGLALVVLGVGLIGDIFEVWKMSELLSVVFFDGWWTLFLIIPCSIGLFKKGDRVFSLIGLVIGVLLLLNEQGIKLSKKALLSLAPALIIYFGACLIYNGLFGKQAKVLKGIKAGNANHSVLFGSESPSYNNANYNGGNNTCIFGGLDLELRNAYINNVCKMNCYSIFGSIEVHVPNNVKVVVSSTPIFGSTSNNFINCPDFNAPTVYINCVSVFGSVEIN